jgi:signal transduction histidine kinase
MYRQVVFKLLLFITLGLILGVPLIRNASGVHPLLVIASVLVVPVAFFFLPRRKTDRLADKGNRNLPHNLKPFSQNIEGKLLVSNFPSALQKDVAQALAGVMNLKSALLLAGPDVVYSRLVALAGEMAEDILHYLSSQIGSYNGNGKGQGFVELPWESSSVLVISLSIGSQHVGYAVLGPKESGEVFAEEDKQALALIIPILAIVVDSNEPYQRLKALNERLIRTLGSLNLHLGAELKLLNQRLLQAREDERLRMASDLHDGPLQKALLLIQKIDRDQEDVEILARQLASELRETASQLRPSILDDLGIVAALDWLIRDMTKDSGFHASLSLHNIDAEKRFPPDIELALFRISQEMVNNAVEHSQGTFLEICLSKDGDDIVLQVTDNGVGLPSTSQGNNGFGLSGMQRRAAQLGGSFTIHPAPGQGTTVIARIPLIQRSWTSSGGAR